MAGMDDCIGHVQGGDENISREDAQGVLDLVDARAQRLEREGMAPSEAMKAAGQQVFDEAAAAAAKRRINALENLQKRTARRQRIQDTAAAIGGDKGPDLGTALRNQVIAIATPVEGGRFSAEAFAKAREKDYLGAIVELKKAGLLNAARSGAIERDWARELYELSMQAAGEDGKPGVTGNAQAQQIAEILHKYQSLAKERLNRQGGWIGDYAGYITRTSHDALKIFRAGEQAWIDTIRPLLDVDRTFEGVDDPQAFLSRTWHALATGIHLSDEGGVGMKDPAFVGPANLAGKVSEGRVLHFRDADAWLDYQHAFGSGTVLEQVMQSFQRASRQEALLERWGTNPEAEFLNDARWLQEEYRDRDPGTVIRAATGIEKAKTDFDVLTGKANMPESRLVAQIASNIRTIESMAKLGGVAFTHLSAGVTKAAELRYQGVGFLERYGDFIGSIFQGRGAGEMRELADLLLSGTEGMHGTLLNRFTPDDTMPGTMSKIANRYFSATGLTYLLDAQKAGAERVLSRHLGRQIGEEFGDLLPETQRGLRQYGITPDEWDALRTAPGHFTTDDGRVFLTPDAARRAPGEMSDTARDMLALKLNAYYRDVADRSIVTPGIGDRILTRGSRPGSVIGEAMRFMAQFKTWGIAAVRQGIGREVYGGQGTAGAISGLMQMAIGATALGYVTMTLKDVFKGNVPRSPDDPHTWEAALIQGGGFGILGDYLFGQYSRFGGSFSDSLLGPVLGQGVTEMMNIWNDLKSGDTKRKHDIPAEAARIAINNTPFINLFYTRAALNYLFLNSIQESLNPGYLQRSQKRVEQQTGQRSFLSPMNHLHTFGR